MENYSKVAKSAMTYRVVKRSVWFVLAALFVLFFFLMINQTVVGVVISLFLIVFLFFTAWLEYQNLGFDFDDKSLKWREGLFSLSTQIIPYVKISNVEFRQSVTQRMFNVGTLILDQEDSQSNLHDIDKESADKILSAVATHSNIQQMKNVTQ